MCVNTKGGLDPDSNPFSWTVVQRHPKAETPYKLTEWPTPPGFKTGTLKISEAFEFELAPFAVGTFGFSASPLRLFTMIIYHACPGAVADHCVKRKASRIQATEDLSTTAGKGENKLKLELSGGLQFMMPGNWELDLGFAICGDIFIWLSKKLTSVKTGHGKG